VPRRAGCTLSNAMRSPPPYCTLFADIKQDELI
jgi:hypothetical protein